MTQQVTTDEALVLCMLALSENNIPHRAIYDMGYVVMSPIEMVIACDAIIRLKEIVDDYYGKETSEVPSYEISYYEAGDGGPEWLEDDDGTADEDA